MYSEFCNIIDRKYVMHTRGQGSEGPRGASSPTASMWADGGGSGMLVPWPWPPPEMWSWRSRACMVKRLTSHEVQGERREEHGVVPRGSTRPQT